MKRLYVLIITFIFVCNYSFGQKTIRMEKDGGIYKISCKVNGAPMKMYFDTGASTVSISKATAIYLLDNDLISPQDFRGKTKTATADGSISDNMVINLKDIEIAGLHLRNVLATVSYSLNAPLLLGQTAIQRLGKISLHGNILTIYTNTSDSNQNNLNREELDRKLRYLRDTRFSNKDFSYESLEIIEKIETNNVLNEFELFCKIMSLANTLKYDDAISAAQTWIDRYASNTDSIDWKMRVYFIAAQSNMFCENGNKEKGMEYLRRCENYWRKISDKTSAFFWMGLPLIIGEFCDYKNIGHFEEVQAAKESVEYFLRLDNISLKDININKCNNWEYKDCFYSLLLAYISQYDWNRMISKNPTKYESKMVKILYILAAKVGVEEAIEWLRMKNIDFLLSLTTDELNVTGIQ